jgi:hypothetical protein
MLHILTCLWIFQYEQDNAEGSAQLYLDTFFFVTESISTVGYGISSPLLFSESQMFFTMLMMVISRYIYIQLISTTMSLISKYEKVTFFLVQAIDEFRLWLFKIYNANKHGLYVSYRLFDKLKNVEHGQIDNFQLQLLVDNRYFTSLTSEKKFAVLQSLFSSELDLFDDFFSCMNYEDIIQILSSTRRKKFLTGDYKSIFEEEYVYFITEGSLRFFDSENKGIFPVLFTPGCVIASEIESNSANFVNVLSDCSISYFSKSLIPKGEKKKRGSCLQSWRKETTLKNSPLKRNNVYPDSPSSSFLLDLGYKNEMMNSTERIELSDRNFKKSFHKLFAHKLESKPTTVQRQQEDERNESDLDNDEVSKIDSKSYEELDRFLNVLDEQLKRTQDHFDKIKSEVSKTLEQIVSSHKNWRMKNFQEELILVTKIEPKVLPTFLRKRKTLA